MPTKEDLTLLQQSMPMGIEGVRLLERILRDGNSDVRKLIYDEANLMLECSFCRSWFRAPMDFLNHKITYCRGSVSAVILANRGARGGGAGRAVVAPKRRSLSIKPNPLPNRDNQGTLELFTLPRIMKEVPTMDDGFLKMIGGLPSDLAHHVLASLPDDRTPVMMPQDNSSRYTESLGSQSSLETQRMEENEEEEEEEEERTRVMMPQGNSSRFKEMPLSSQSSRKIQSTGRPQKREFTSAEMKIIEHFEKHSVRCGDAALLKCEHPECAHFLPFHSVQALAYHCSLRHTKPVKNDVGEGRWPCLICGRVVMRSLEGVYEHMLRKHPEVKEDHLDKRIEDEKNDKGGRKSTDSRRSRSLSFSSEIKEAIKKESETIMKKKKYDDSEEEEDRVGRTLSICRNSRSARGRRASMAPPVMKQPKMIQRLSGGTGISVYGHLPKLNAVDPSGFQMEADEDEDDKPLSSFIPKKSMIKRENGGGKKEVRGKIEDDEKEKRKHDPNTVEGCMEDMLDDVCNEKEKESTIKRENTGDSSVSLPAKRGRHPLDQTNQPIVVRKSRTLSVGPRLPTPEIRLKRQYIRKKDREAMEMALSGAASAAETARPSRQCKRPSWMMYEGEKVDGDGTESSQSVDQSTADENEAGPSTGERTKKKKTENQRATPVQKKDSTPEQKEPGVIRIDQNYDPLLFTPKAGKAVMERRRAMGILEKNAGSSSKRKQNLGQLIDSEEDIMIVPVNDGMGGQKRSDLEKMKVYLTEHVQSIFFSGLMAHQNTERPGKMYYECMHCNVKLPNLRDGRRHMVAHLRVMRFRCGLCGAGAFFCIDIRNHLQLRGCPGLNKAPKHMILPGTPCMTKEHADELSYAAHPDDPGHAIFTSGKIVSIMSNTPYLPDPVIEEKILGPTRVPPRGVPSSPLKKAKKDMGVAPVLSVVSDTMPILSIEETSAARTIPIVHRSMHRPIVNRRERSPDYSFPSTSK